ncbi:NmrA/HSCARG family protein [Burkholderia sp. Bp9142]|uniref:NmrA/HSCARG family protein n=1 Tax=Burkholderia sp. Bp9142 TaxID=2184573 RepID=UPI000F5B05A2|nr:NmrA/HSCARG family protein [Burkholderia sp. Bp9142]RQR24607.1 NmrA/HSCARG family protein [Burkholderia sp. Bp9142]
MNVIRNASAKTVVVLGATGRQGGAVARVLAAEGQWQVRTISRNPDSEVARRLASSGIDVVLGNMDDPTTLLAAFRDVYGVYSMQGTDQGMETEVKRGIAVANAALASGVEHFIYASVGGADRGTGVLHFESKWRIEEHVRRIGLPATIIRPVFFMDNFIRLPMRLVLMALMRSYVPRAKPLQMIAVDDIGKWVARAFSNPEYFVGRVDEIAGDELTSGEIVAAFRDHGWYPGLPVPFPRGALRPLPTDVLKMFEWFAVEGYKADITALRELQPGMLRFTDWLSANRRGSSTNRIAMRA